MVIVPLRDASRTDLTILNMIEEQKEVKILYVCVSRVNSISNYNEMNIQQIKIWTTLHNNIDLLR